ncbi:MULTISPECIES: squalene/phytoene synthase family protein [Marinovum]|uniref:squalene/phytoene synthase family protein n=1 Tax=Marinovum TaxID=367771 RepID=UPI00237A1E02|nr:MULTISPECIES: squalene/phytoene synthase family protein [Marinovum]MDD9744158.1 squalene/phytoene synthase family protein [Marinovum sp. PR37]
MADWHACAALVEKGDPDRFMAVMSCDVAARARLFPLFAFNLEVARAPWMTQEPMIAEMRLQWWRDALAEIAAGGLVRRHEVVTPLALVLTPEQGALLDGLIDARRQDIGREGFASESEFEAYIEATSGNLLYAAALWYGAPDEAAVRDVAYGAGVAHYLVAVPELEARGHRPLVDGRPEAVRALAAAALERLRRGRAAVSPAQSVALRSTWQAEALLKQVTADPGRVARGSLGLSDAGKRARLIWRALRSGV